MLIAKMTLFQAVSNWLCDGGVQKKFQEKSARRRALKKFEVFVGKRL